MPDETRCASVKTRPGVEAFKTFVMQHLGGGAGNIKRACGPKSGHSSARAWDWSVPPEDASKADALVDWLLADNAEMFRRAGLAYLIWDREIFSPGRGLHAYHGASPHKDHVHFSFGDRGAEGRTSFYTETPGVLPPRSSSWAGPALGLLAGAASWWLVRGLS